MQGNGGSGAAGGRAVCAPVAAAPWHLLVREVLSQLLGLQSQAASHRGTAGIERRCSWCLQITRHEQAAGWQEDGCWWWERWEKHRALHVVCGAADVLLMIRNGSRQALLVQISQERAELLPEG